MINDGQILNCCKLTPTGGRSSSRYSFMRLMIVVLVLSIVVMGGALFGRIGAVPILVSCLAIIASTAIICAYWTVNSISHVTLRNCLIWMLYIVLVVATVTLFSGVRPSNGTLAFIALLSVLPFSIYVIRMAGNFPFTITVFVNVVTILALCSTTLWLLGPVTGLMQPNCTIPNTWNVAGEVRGYFDGYFFLLFNTQYAFGIFRNTSIYGEVPIFVVFLISALSLEVFVSEKPRRAPSTVLAITLISTFSPTAVALLLLTIILSLYSTKINRELSILYFTRSLLPILAIASLTIVALIILGKLETSSGSIHWDDYKAGINAWLSSPVFGLGLGSDDLLLPFMSSFRFENTGFSNTLLLVLAKGGLLYFSVWAYAIAGFFKLNKRYECVGVIIVITLISSYAASYFIATFLLAIGAEMMLFDSAGNQCANNVYNLRG